MTEQTPTDLAVRDTLPPVSIEAQAEALEQVVIHGDLAKLTPPQRVAYYRQVCATLGLNAFTKPFQYISLNSRLTLYPTRDATDQLRRNHRISVDGLERHTDTETGIHTVVATGTDRHGRRDSAMGAVSIRGLGGEALANAYMKAETKAKRRLTLSLAGLGMFDESEVDYIEDAVTVRVDDDGNLVATEATEGRPVTALLMDRLGALARQRDDNGAAPEPEGQTVQGEAVLQRTSQVTADADVQPADEPAQDPAPEVVPGQVALPLDTEQTEPEKPKRTRRSRAKADEPATVAPSSETWVARILNDVVEDVDAKRGSGLRLKAELADGAQAQVAFHGPALEALAAMPAEATEVGQSLTVTGTMVYVPWERDGQAMPPYRRILADTVVVAPS